MNYITLNEHFCLRINDIERWIYNIVLYNENGIIETIDTEIFEMNMDNSFEIETPLILSEQRFDKMKNFLAPTKFEITEEWNNDYDLYIPITNEKFKLIKKDKISLNDEYSYFKEDIYQIAINGTIFEYSKNFKELPTELGTIYNMLDNLRTDASHDDLEIIAKHILKNYRYKGF